MEQRDGNLRTILTLVATVGVIFLAWKLSSVILLFLTALMLSAAISPIVKQLNKRLSLTLSTVLVLLILFIPLVGLFLSFLPGLFKQIPEILESVNRAFHNSTFLPELQNIDLSSYTQQSAEYLLHSTGKITVVVASFITLIVLAAYILIDAESLRKLLLGIVPLDKQEKVDHLLADLAKISGDYIRGNLTISLICSLVIFVGLLILKVPYPIALAGLAGILDLLPLVGGLVGAILPVILAFTVSPTTGFLTILLFFIYQQVENNFLAPKIYNKALDLSPTLSLLAVIIGATLYGIPGAFIALPIAASIPAFLKYLK